MEHLATVMRLYGKRAFSRDCFQWTKCVIKYLHDACSPPSPLLLILLAEVRRYAALQLTRRRFPFLQMLERSASIVHLPVLQVMYCVFHHVDFGSSPVAINGDFLKAVAKHIQAREHCIVLLRCFGPVFIHYLSVSVQGPNWREAARIMKLAVTRSSSLSVPASSDASDLEAGRRELPGLRQISAFVITLTST